MPAPVIKDGPYPFRCPEKENVWLLLPIREVKIEPVSDTSTSDTADDSTDTDRNDRRDELELFNSDQEQEKHNPKIKEKDITIQQRNDFLEHQIDHNNIDMETF